VALRCLVSKQQVEPIDRFVTLLMMIYACVQASYFVFRVPALPSYQVITYPTVIVCLTLFVDWLVRHVPAPMQVLGKLILLVFLAANLWFTANVVTFIRTSPELIKGDYGSPYATQWDQWQEKIEDWTARIH
jgi:hypothetical protein